MTAETATEATQDTVASRPTLNAGRGGILGVKAGMTQVYNEEGEVFAVTVIDLQPNTVTQVKTLEKDGYVGVQVGFIPKKLKNSNKAELGHVKKAGKEKGYLHYQEFRLPKGAALDGVTAGVELSADFLKVGDMVDIVSISKGKGFQGVMKRYNFGGGNASHGASVCHRSPGSIGNRADPGKVFKGKKMAGQMGLRKTTVQNLKVIAIDSENRTIAVHGSVPGPRSGMVTVLRSIKGLKKQG